MLRGGESTRLEAFKYLIVPYTRGAGVELGRGPYKAYPHFIAVRERTDDKMPKGVEADVWLDRFDQVEDNIVEGSLDFVVAWDVDAITWQSLEHGIAKKLLKEGGHYIAFTDELRIARKVGDELLLVDQRVAPAGVKTACIVRHGAIGDTLQAMTILPELKRQGYHVTWMCHPDGQELLKSERQIDAFLVQDKDQVPNHLLHLYWKTQAARFDKFINLCESVEGTLIALPGRALHRFPHAVRHSLCNRNYLEFTSELAETLKVEPYYFTPTADESKTADALLHDIGKAVNPGWVIGQKWVKPFVVMWCLSGSSIHKFYPHQDAVMARIFTEIPHAHVILTGDPACKILEVGWENEPRVHCLSGEQTVRETLAMARYCDLVIGPETGVMNAVAFESCAKITLLSHSSPENLTKHWVNSESMDSPDTPCYPCHQLHFDREFCPEHKESGAAMCQWNIGPDRVWAAVQRAYVGWGTVNNLVRPA